MDITICITYRHSVGLQIYDANWNIMIDNNFVG